VKVPAAGTVLGTTDWLEIDQARIDAFAAAIDDHQWIHVDRERAAAGPFGTTITHGYLTLALLPALLRQVFAPEAALTLNYGLNRVRFPAPVPVGSRLRARFELVSSSEVPGGEQVVVAATVECEGAEKPACVAEVVYRLLA
jgi:acyl dehydratase